MFAALALLLAEPLPTTIPNAGFERGLEGWVATGHRGYRASLGSNYPAPSGRWLTMDWAARNRTPDNAGFQVATTIDARRYRDRGIRISAATRVRNGRGSGAVILFAEAAETAAQAVLLESDDWTRQTLVFHVPRNARTITLGFRIENAGGGIEADDVRLEIMR